MTRLGELAKTRLLHVLKENLDRMMLYTEFQLRKPETIIEMFNVTHKVALVEVPKILTTKRKKDSPTNIETNSKFLL